MSNINLLASLTSIVNQIPDLTEVTFEARDSADSYEFREHWKARRGPMTKADINGMDRSLATWYLYATDCQERLPTRMGKIRHGNDTWHVLNVNQSFGNLHFQCDSVLEVA